MYPVSISPGALKAEEDHRRDICTVGGWMHERGYVASTDGNISLRLDSWRILQPLPPAWARRHDVPGRYGHHRSGRGRKLSGGRNPIVRTLPCTF